MSTSATADIFTEREDWKSPLAFSAFVHAVTFVVLIAWSAFSSGSHGESWGGAGGGGGAMQAQLVGSIPLPRSEAPLENVVVTESKGMSQSQPKQEQAPVAEAIPIPERNAKKVAEQRRSVSETAKPKPVQENVVPFGEGGPARIPAVTFKTNAGSGGLMMGGGDFGSRYSYYVRVVQQKISQNWLQYDLDRSARGRRVYVVFDILRDGSIDSRSVRIEQSSGVPTLDQSALRTLQRIDTFGPLPSDYRSSRVSVEFWFGPE